MKTCGQGVRLGLVVDEFQGSQSPKFQHQGFAAWIGGEGEEDDTLVTSFELPAFEPDCGGWGRLAAFIDDLDCLSTRCDSDQWA